MATTSTEIKSAETRTAKTARKSSKNPASSGNYAVIAPPPESSSHNELIKHSSAVHIANSISLTERKISNILLKHAFHEMNSKPTHTIAISEICRLIGWNESKAYDELKKAVTALNATQIQWNILGKDRKNAWGVTTILAQARIERGICTYAYSPMMKELLASPNIYARLNLLVQRNFRSKHALAIWEFLIESLCTAKTDRITTDWIEVGGFRRLLGIDNDGCYQDFRYLKSKVISPAIEEINNESDVRVEVDYKKEGRRVIGLRFQVHRKNTYQYAMDLDEEAARKAAAARELEEGNAFPMEGTPHSFDYENAPPAKPKSSRSEGQKPKKSSPLPAFAAPLQIALYRRLVEGFGISEKQAQELVADHVEDSIAAAIAYSERQERAGRVKNRKAYVVKAIQQGWKGEEEETRSAIEQLTAGIPTREEAEKAVSDPVWAKVRARLKESLGEATFTHWLAALELSDRKDGRITLKAPGKFHRNHVEGNLLEPLSKAWQAEESSIHEVQITA